MYKEAISTGEWFEMKLRKYQVLWFARRVRRKLTGWQIRFDPYVGRTLLDIQEANDRIAQWIQEERNFAVARLGAIELEAVWKSDLHCSTEKQKRVLHLMWNNAGLFPEDVMILREFTNLMKQSCRQIDLLGVWFNTMEDYVIDKYGKNCELTELSALEPWYAERPWTRMLKGKKVLVIHPFVDTIKSQYKKREHLFGNKEILPEFEALYTVKAVQTIAGTKDDRFQNWFQALDWMYKEAMKEDFDVAVIGCGAYGFPLAAKIKEAGRSAVHMGGATQLLFGIKGRRWDNHPVIGKLYNSYWVRPAESEKPKGAEGVEEGCYW